MISKRHHREQLLSYWEYEVHNTVDCLRAVEHSVGEYKVEHGVDDWVLDFMSEYLEDRRERLSS